MTVVILLPASRKTLICRSIGAIMTPPATHRTLPKFLISDGTPSGPVMFQMQSPSFKRPSCFVVLPTSLNAKVTVPFFASYPAIVSGMRSPFSSMIRIMNCPGRAFSAISGAHTSNSLIFGASSFFAVILYVWLNLHFFRF